MAMATQQVSKVSRSCEYPKPLIVNPLKEHKETWIILHGRGSNVQKFGPELLKTAITDYESLPKAFPHAKLIFPTASLRRATIYKRSLTHQWFDNWSLQTPNEKEGLQTECLRETSALVHRILEDEIAIVGAQKVVLGGLSQGCAAALIALLLWEGQPLAAAFGMCGWLPFREHMEDLARAAGHTEDDINGEDDPFAQDGECAIY